MISWLKLFLKENEMKFIDVIIIICFLPIQAIGYLVGMAAMSFQIGYEKAIFGQTKESIIEWLGAEAP